METPYDDIRFTEDEVGSEDWIEVASWCNEFGIQNGVGYCLEKTESGEYRVVKYIVKTSFDEEIEKLKDFLTDTDNYALRLQTGEAKEEDVSSKYNCTFKEIMVRRTAARIKIKDLEGKNEE